MLFVFFLDLRIYISRRSGVQVFPVTPKRRISGIGKVSSDLSLSLIFPLRVEHYLKKV